MRTWLRETTILAVQSAVALGNPSVHMKVLDCRFALIRPKRDG